MSSAPPAITDDVINDRNAVALRRLEALSALAGSPSFKNRVSGAGKKTGEVNNHIHTIYSFSPYTPAMAALKAFEAGLAAAGSVDHDSYSAADEMRKACAILSLGCVTGFELRVSFRHTEFADRKINSPDSKGIAYMTVQGIPEKAASRVHAFLAPLAAERHKRNRAMVAVLNAILQEADMDPLSYDTGVVPLSMAHEGGSVTERHILYAMSLALISRCGKGRPLLDRLSTRFGVTVAPKIAALLLDTDNPYYPYDLLGVIKSSFNERIFIQPGEAECLKVEAVCEFARSINAFPAYAYLGDVAESPTGDKKAEKFEDDFLDTLFPFLKDAGYSAVTYMPPRNTGAQLARVRSLCERYGFMEICGVDINSPRQSFNCPELLRPEFANLIDTTWALSAHEKRNEL
ncbi:MAG: PHP domain-containing protein [Treponema sp.]|jgi:hypothetical protein|nr:PHP domain-containing protein [Treponema sp.]